jgi:hypothetical protein
MKRLIIIFIGAIFTLSALAQAKQGGVASTGGNDTNGNISLNWTLGKLIVPTFSKGNVSLSHGYNIKLIVTAYDENLDFRVDIKVYPNPASEYINIQFEEILTDVVSVTMIDSNGKLVMSDVISQGMSEKLINIQDLPSGLYYLRLIRGKLVNVYKVVKL